MTTDDVDADDSSWTSEVESENFEARAIVTFPRFRLASSRFEYFD